MNILLTGGTGFIGTALIKSLVDAGHHVTVLTRSASRERQSSHAISYHSWDGRSFNGTSLGLPSIDAVINLAGESIGGKRWTTKTKERIISSRLEATRALVEQIARGNISPSLFLSGSAIGFYGNRLADFRCTEDAPRGSGFLSDVVEAWEAEALRAEEFGVHVARLRIGLVLGRDGGVLSKLTLPFRLFSGSYFGTGEQGLSWIHRDDLMSIIDFILKNRIEGPINCVAPDPLPMKEFCRILGRVLRRPLWLRIPAWAAKIILGQMSETVLEGQFVEPKRLRENGFTFRFTHLEQALADLLL